MAAARTASARRPSRLFPRPPPRTPLPPPAPSQTARVAHAQCGRRSAAAGRCGGGARGRVRVGRCEEAARGQRDPSQVRWEGPCGARSGRKRGEDWKRGRRDRGEGGAVPSRPPAPAVEVCVRRLLPGPAA